MLKTKNLFVIAPCLLLSSVLIGCNPGNNSSDSWINKENWYELTSEATTADIGKTVKVKVNNVNHLVRLIDIDHDVDSKGNKIHTTWEFVNLISDKNGNSLSWLWDDRSTNNESGAELNTDYPNSAIRYALCGSGNNGQTGDDPRTTILVGVKGSQTWVNEFKDKTVLSMLPNNLVKHIKTTKKTVGTTTNYIETPYEDKLFMASAIELGFDDKYTDKGFGTTYAYYKSATKITDKKRTKRQVNSLIVSDSTCYIPCDKDSGQLSNTNVNNYAGFNGIVNGVLGGRYWLRSPYIIDSVLPDYKYVSYCDPDGDLTAYKCEYNRAYGLAPMFCI